jgi:tetratricopeptide (TPR) repeat protein
MRNRIFLAAVLSMALGGVSACGIFQSGGPKLAELSENATPAERAFYFGMKAGYAEQWGESVTHFAEAVRLDPESQKARVNYGVALERSGDLKAASGVYREVFEADSENLAAVRNLVRSLIAVDELKEARTVLTKASKAAPENPELLNSMSGVLRRLKKYDAAAAAARKVLLRDQNNAAAIKNLALIYADTNKLQLAETFFINAMKLAEKDASIRVNLGLIAYRRGDHQRAIKEFEEALKLDPKNAVAFMNIGAIRLSFRDYGRAESSFNSAIEAGMLNCTTAAALGYAFEGQSDKTEEALDQMGKAYDLCPRDTDLLFTMGEICMNRLRDDARALKFFEQYVELKKGLAKDHMVYQNIEILKEQMAMSEELEGEELPEELSEEGQESEVTENANESAESDGAADPESLNSASPDGGAKAATPGAPEEEEADKGGSAG